MPATYLRDHAGDVAGRRRQKDRVALLRQVAERSDVLLGDGQRNSVESVLSTTNEQSIIYSLQYISKMLYIAPPSPQWVLMHSLVLTCVSL